MFQGNPWYEIMQTDPRAVALYKRHYSAQRGNRYSGISGPGETITLLTADGRALWLWRYTKYASLAVLRDAACCTVFRNEGTSLSSLLVGYAEEFARREWPDRPMVTFVDPSKVASPNPGYCFKVAGWVDVGITSSGLRILRQAL